MRWAPQKGHESHVARKRAGRRATAIAGRLRTFFRLRVDDLEKEIVRLSGAARDFLLRHYRLTQVGEGDVKAFERDRVVFEAVLVLVVDARHRCQGERKKIRDILARKARRRAVKRGFRLSQMSIDYE